MVANMPGKKKKINESNILDLLDESLGTDNKSNVKTQEKTDALSSAEYLKLLSNVSIPC